MNIETKVVKVYNYSSYDENKDELMHFGWVHTEDTEVHEGRGYKPAYVMARDKNMPNYAAITALEKHYFNLKHTKKTYTPMEASNVLLAFVAFIIPGVLYVTFKSKQKKRIKEHNAAAQKQMDEIVAKAKLLL
ncbi:MAG: hypothetical protein K2J01_04550 [Clostridiales bacterium]|nr:hypothetical protein [Clostridiales bacterium]